MQDEEELSRFIEEQRAKIAHDRDILKNNPVSAITDNTLNRQILKMNKENREPTDSALPVSSRTNDLGTTVEPHHGRPPSTPRIFRLGDEYKKKREKLKEELRADYRNAMAEKNLRTTGVRAHHPGAVNVGIGGKDPDLGLSLPIKDRLSAKAKDAATETYEDLLNRKRKQEKSYRAVNEDQEDFREKPRFRDYDEDDEDDDGYYSQRRVRFPSKGRRSLPRKHRHYYDDRYDDDDRSYPARSRRRRGRGRRRGRTSSSEDEEEDDYSDEDVRFERRRRDTSIDKRKPAPLGREATTGSLSTSKEKKEADDLRSRSAPPDQENTGLQIGHVPSANTVQRRKEEYRVQLLQQMEERKLAKKREKELDRQIDAASVRDIDTKKTGNKSLEKEKDSSPPKRSAASPQMQEGKHQKKKGKRSSLKYKFDSSEEEEQDIQRTRFRGYPRPGFYPPPPQQPMGYYPPQFPTPYDEAYYYYGSRNPLDPPGVMPQAPPPGMYQEGMSPMMAAAMGQNRDRSDEQGKIREGADSFNLNSSRRTVNKNESSLVADDKRDDENKRQKMIQYQEELKYQMAEKERAKKAAREEQEKYDQKMEEEARNYNPWGKGGGGAPMKDRHGNLVTDLRQMHLENEEMVMDPNKAQEIVKERLPQTNLYRREDRPVIDLSPRNAGPDDMDTSPRFGRNNPFELKQSDEQRAQRDTYKDYLEKQIEEKKKLEAEKRERERIEEEKEEKRLAEQRKRIQAELEAELEKDRNKREQAERQNEQLRLQAEERKREEKRKRLEEREKHDEEIRQKREEELNERLHASNPSPVIPALQTQEVATTSTHPTHQPPPQQQQPVEDTRTQRPVPQPHPVSHTPQILTYRARSPNKDDDRSRMRSRAESKRISRELSALRKQLLSEQRRVENQLRTVDMTSSNFQSQKAKTEYLVDLSRARQKPVTVRRPPTVEKDRPSSKALKEFTDYKYRPDDTASIRMFRTEYPETPSDAKALERQQEALLARQGRNLESLRQQEKSDQDPNVRRKKVKDPGYLPPPTAQSRASLLEADTSYIPVYPGDEDDYENGLQLHSNQSSAPQSRGSRRPSARERRRMTHKPPSAQSEQRIPPRARADNFSLNSLSSLATLDVDRLANKNQDRLDKLRAMQGDDISLTDPDDILDRFVNKHKGSDGPRRRPFPNEDGYGGVAGTSGYRDPDAVDVGLPSFNTRPPSVNTVDTEPWLRPETGPTVA